MVIYQITNIITSDFYIGKSNNPKDRFYKHKYNAINKKKLNFIMPLKTKKILGHKPDDGIWFSRSIHKHRV